MERRSREAGVAGVLLGIMTCVGAGAGAIASLKSQPGQEGWIEELIKVVRSRSYKSLPIEVLVSGDAQRILRGLDGASRIVAVKPSSLDVLRGFVPEQSIEGPLLFRPRIAYFKIRYFGRRTARDFFEALRKISSKPPTGLIIDLRCNHGGLLAGAKELTEAWIPAGEPFLTVVGRDEKSSTFVSSNAKPLKLPTVLLVDAATASCAEIFAASLKAAKKAQWVGVPTYGKRSIQEAFPLDARHLLFLTTGHYRLPGMNSRALVPDVHVSRASEQLKTALKLIRSQGNGS